MLEAMAYSKPIIGPDISAIPEVIKNNINVFEALDMALVK